MNLSRRSSDALVGLLVVAAVVVLLVTLSITQKWNQRRVLFYMRTNSAQDLSVDTKVYYQGLEVGEVSSIYPVVDSSMGALSFLVALRVRERYENGRPLVMPVGTSAEIRTSGVLGQLIIAIVVPTPPSRAMVALQPGDTLESIVVPTPLDAIRGVADSVTQQIKLVLSDSRKLIDRLTGTARQANTELSQTGPEVRRTLQEVQTTLAQLRPVLAKATSLIDSTGSRTPEMLDSVSSTLAQTKVLIGHLDSLTTLAHAMAQDSRADLKQTMSNMLVISAKLDHFVDQVSRRPLKMITGVRPLPPESLPAAKP